MSSYHFPIALSQNKTIIVGVFAIEIRLCHRAVILDKKLYSALSLFTQVYECTGTGDHNAGGRRGDDLVTEQHPIQGVVTIFLGYRNHS